MAARPKALPGAAASDGVKTPIAPGIIARLTGAVRYVVTGAGPEAWFGPGQPLTPVAQREAQGRQFDYPVYVNYRYTPRGDEAISFGQLRALADSCDVVRLAIETRKDQLCNLEFGVVPKDDEKDPDDRCQQVQDFLQLPDREHDWKTWLRMVLEDMFVIDAATVYPRATRGGGVYSLDPMDGGTIARLINPDGRTPLPPEPAYQQALKGLPAVDYHRDELLYLPRNPRTNKLYGFSPVEQIVVTVNIAIRKQLQQLTYFSRGSTPDLIFGVPKEWNPDQTRQFKEWWDGLLEGNLENRAGTMFVPSDVKPIDTKERALKDDFDEWLARIVCYAFSLPPTAFVKQMNRATSDTAQEVALEEGLGPCMQRVAGLMNQIIWRWFGYTDLKFDWQQTAELDQLVQAEVNQIYLQNKVIAPSEVRADLGRDAMTPEQLEEVNPPPPPALDPNNPEAAASAGGPGGVTAPPAAGGGKTGKLVKKKASRRSIAIARRSRGRVRSSATY